MKKLYKVLLYVEFNAWSFPNVFKTYRHRYAYDAKLILANSNEEAKQLYEERRRTDELFIHPWVIRDVETGAGFYGHIRKEMDLLKEIKVCEVNPNMFSPKVLTKFMNLNDFRELIKMGDAK